MRKNGSVRTATSTFFSSAGASVSLGDYGVATKITSQRLPHASAGPPAAAEEGIVITDLHLKPIAFNNGAAVILNGSSPLSETAGRPVRLPPEVVEAITSRNGADVSVVRSHFHKNGATYRCDAYRVQPLSAELAQPVMALLLLKVLSVDDAIGVAAAGYGLTDREQEVFRGILMGDSTKELAARLQISPNTIKAFLRLIMGKMGVTTRSGIFGKLLDEMEKFAVGGNWRTSARRRHREQ
jgi:DNA-binding CsgD family transcriptional regulator